MAQWRRNLSAVLRDSTVEAALLSRIRYHDPTPTSWVVLDAFQKYFSPKNTGSVSNFFIFKDGSCLRISREGVFWGPNPQGSPSHKEDCEYSTWYIAQRVGSVRWATTFLSPFPDDDS
jgi:hypothetical protein